MKIGVTFTPRPSFFYNEKDCLLKTYDEKRVNETTSKYWRSRIYFDFGSVRSYTVYDSKMDLSVERRRLSTVNVDVKDLVDVLRPRARIS